jgi:glycosyltransferase involved in cell wall biosynthesis
MKILFLSFYYQPDLCAGSFRATALITELKKKLPDNSSIDVVSTMPNRYQSFEVGNDVAEYEQDENVSVHRIPLPTHKSGMIDQIKAFYRFYQGAKKIVASKEYDLVFATSSRLFTAFLGANISRNKKIPLYLDIRDIFVDTLSDVLSKKVSLLLVPFLKQIENYTFNRASKINLVSEGFSEYFKNRFNKQYSFYSNGIDDEFIKPIVDKASTHDIITVLYAGNIGEGQGLHKIIPELAKKSAGQYKFVIIGDGGKAEELKANVKLSGVTNVEFLPPVNRTQLIKHYQAADVLFMHLNDYDAFEKVLPSKIFEYGALGKPVLAGVSGFAAQFVNNNVSNANVFYPCDSTAGYKALRSLDIKDSPRIDFVSTFKRTNIMSDMAQSIIGTTT